VEVDDATSGDLFEAAAERKVNGLVLGGNLIFSFFAIIAVDGRRATTTQRVRMRDRSSLSRFPSICSQSHGSDSTMEAVRVSTFGKSLAMSHDRMCRSRDAIVLMATYVRCVGLKSRILSKSSGGTLGLHRV
jgi:hypothetical protein